MSPCLQPRLASLGIVLFVLTSAFGQNQGIVARDEYFTIASQTTAVSTVTVTVSFDPDATSASSTPSTDDNDNTMSYTGSAFQSAVLNSTNYYRTHHDAEAVTWNDTLATYAQQYAQQCIWKHSGGPYGENLAAGYASSTAAVDAWGNEGAEYNYQDPGFSEQTGHFTQLVWKSTRTVGCGAVQCQNSASDGVEGWYLVCEYYPPGNYIGSFASNVSAAQNPQGMIGLSSGADRPRGRARSAAVVFVAISLFVSWMT